MTFKHHMLVLTTAIALSACETTSQYTSGADYLTRSQTAPVSTATSATDEAVRQIAAVEPDLRFPARIGLARIQRHQLVGVPADEAQSWIDAVNDMKIEFGEFVPVSPLVAEMVSSQHRTKGDTVVDQIRRGAARQHLDYVIAYEVSDKAVSNGNALRLADLTMLGLFVLPSRNLEAEATASAILLDVRNGYPYLTGSTFADKSALTTVVGRGDKKAKLRNAARQVAVAQIAENFADGIRDLKHVADGVRLAENQAVHSASSK